MIDIILWLLAVQGAIGAFDVFYNHEWDAACHRSPPHGSSWPSIPCAPCSMPWCLLGWHGGSGMGLQHGGLGALIGVEIILTLWDFVVEDRTRKLSPQERIVHTILAMNGGAYVGFLVYIFATDWALQPTASPLWIMAGFRGCSLPMAWGCSFGSTRRDCFTRTISPCVISRYA